MATYYIDPAGSDSNPGTSIGSPWKTPSKVTLFSASIGFAPGDAILFRSGKTHVPAASAENITLSQNGTSVSPIQIGAYGDGDAPILLLGNAPLTTWSLVSGEDNTWHNSYAGSVVPGLWETGTFLRHGDSISALAPGEYYWNSASNAYFALDANFAVGIYVRPTSGVASDWVYQRCSSTVGISLSNRSHIWVRDLALRCGYTGAVYANGTTSDQTNLRVLDCDVRECRSALQFETTNGYANIACIMCGNTVLGCGHGCGMENSTAGGGAEQSIGCVFHKNVVGRIHLVDKWSRVGAFLDKEGFFFMNPVGCSITWNQFIGPGGMAGGAMGLWTDDVTASFENTVIANNYVENIQGRVVSLGGANDTNNGKVRMCANLAINCDADCAVKLNITPGANGGIVHNNTFINCGDVDVLVAPSCAGWTVADNVFVRRGGSHVSLGSGGSFTSERNCWYGGVAPALGTGDFTDDPQIDAVGRLRAGSPCIGYGAFYAGLKHFGGVSMNSASPDIGAHRFFEPRDVATSRRVALLRG